MAQTGGSLQDICAHTSADTPAPALATTSADQLCNCGWRRQLSPGGRGARGPDTLSPRRHRSASHTPLRSHLQPPTSQLSRTLCYPPAPAAPPPPAHQPPSGGLGTLGEPASCRSDGRHPVTVPAWWYRQHHAGTTTPAPPRRHHHAGTTMPAPPRRHRTLVASGCHDAATMQHFGLICPGTCTGGTR